MLPSCQPGYLTIAVNKEYVSILITASQKYSISDIESPLIIIKTPQDILKFRGNSLFKSLLDKSSCLTTLLEVKYENDVLDVINMINGYHLIKKHIHFIVHTFNNSMFQNLALNYDVILHEKNAGTKY